MISFGNNSWHFLGTPKSQMKDVCLSFVVSEWSVSRGRALFHCINPNLYMAALCVSHLGFEVEDWTKLYRFVEHDVVHVHDGWSLEKGKVICLEFDHYISPYFIPFQKVDYAPVLRRHRPMSKQAQWPSSWCDHQTPFQTYYVFLGGTAQRSLIGLHPYIR